MLFNIFSILMLKKEPHCCSYTTLTRVSDEGPVFTETDQEVSICNKIQDVMRDPQKLRP